MTAGWPASELGQRVVSGLVLATITIAATVAGGLISALFWLAASIVVLVEWQKLVAGTHRPLVVATGVAALVSAAAGALFSWPLALLLGVVIALGVGLLPGGGLWSIGGVVYAGVLVVAAILCRGTAPGAGEDGLVAMLFLFATVWGSDVSAYFAGRALGGPKLWPRVSPNKTWSGAVGGMLGALLLGCLVLWLAGIRLHPMHPVLALLLSVATQAGDLFESAVKRRFHAKDAGQLIPGHGGLMDRVDGFIVAAGLAALIGGLRAGLDHVPRGLLQW